MNKIYCYKDYKQTIEKYFNNTDIERIPLGKADRRINYLVLHSGLDIETSTIYEKENEKVTNHFSFLYIWQFQVNNITFFGRTIKELANFITILNNHFINLHNERIICFIHNMSFEFQFLAKELETYGLKTTVFAREKRKPMKWELSNIIFLDSYRLTNLSLSKMAKNYCHTQKMVGDLDYSLVRTKYTHLTKKEFRYCRNDVVILAEYSQYYFNEYIRNGYLPMTSTMISNFVMKEIITERKESQQVYYLMKECYPKSKREYEYIMSFYSGAYTHGMNINLFDKKTNGLSFDVNSEYPYVMMSKHYPMSKFKRLKNLDFAQNFLDNYCCLVDCTLHNIKSKKGVTILSKNNLIDCKNGVFDNGRLYKADSCRVHITEIDIKTLKLHYNFEIEYHYISYAKRGYLPTYVRLTIAYLYAQKNLLKGVKGKEREYQAVKSKLNAVYGACCTKLCFINNIFDEDWKQEENDIDFNKVWIGKNKLPQWAVWITAHARNLILTAVGNIVNTRNGQYNYWYSDTDSIKCANKKYILNMFEKMNNEIYQDNQKFINELNLKELYPTTDFSQLGQFAREEDLKEFKTLGSKRYLYTTYDNEIHQTVAGLPKNVIKNYCEKHNKNTYEFFSDKGINISDSDTEKLCVYYSDTKETRKVYDYLGNSDIITVYSYVSLIPTKFSLTIQNELINLVMRLKGVQNARN